MAIRGRHTEKPIVSHSRAARTPTHAQKLRFITRFKSAIDPTNRRSVDRQYRALRQQEPFQHKADKKQIAILKKRGFLTTDKTVVIDRPRTSQRKHIKGARLAIHKDGTIKWSVKQRRDLIIGLTKKEKQEFVIDPQNFIRNLLVRLRKEKPEFRKIRKPQVRLQWGAYQATKDFSPSLFWLSSSPLGKKSRETSTYRKKREATQDRLTGLHIVYFVRKKKRRKT